MQLLSRRGTNCSDRSIPLLGDADVGDRRDGRPVAQTSPNKNSKFRLVLLACSTLTQTYPCLLGVHKILYCVVSGQQAYLCSPNNISDRQLTEPSPYAASKHGIVVITQRGFTCTSSLHALAFQQPALRDYGNSDMRLCCNKSMYHVQLTQMRMQVDLCVPSKHR